MLTVFDISDPADITPVDYTQNFYEPYSLFGLATLQVQGDYLYTTSNLGDRFIVFDIIDPENPEPIGEYLDKDTEYSLEDSYSLVVSGDYAYYNSVTDDTLVVMDISDKTNPTPVGAYSNSETPYSTDGPRSIAVSGDYVYTGSIIDGSVTIFDVSDKTNPVPVGEYLQHSPDELSSKGIEDMVVIGDRLYISTISSNSFVILDVSDKTNPIAVSGYSSNGGEDSIQSAAKILVEGDLAFVSGIGDHNIVLFDISDETDIKYLGSHSSIDGDYSTHAVQVANFYGDYIFTVSAIDNVLSSYKITEKGYSNSGSYESDVFDFSKEITRTDLVVNDGESSLATFQARFCLESDCSGEEFVGPDGTSETSYDVDGLNSWITTKISEGLSYGQYKITLSSSDMTETPTVSNIGFSYPIYQLEVAFIDPTPVDYGVITDSLLRIDWSLLAQFLVNQTLLIEDSDGNKIEQVFTDSTITYSLSLPTEDVYTYSIFVVDQQGTTNSTEERTITYAVPPVQQELSGSTGGRKLVFEEPKVVVEPVQVVGTGDVVQEEPQEEIVPLEEPVIEEILIEEPTQSFADDGVINVFGFMASSASGAATITGNAIGGDGLAGVSPVVLVLGVLALAGGIFAFVRFR